MKNNPNRNEVIEICKALVTYTGNVDNVNKSLNYRFTKEIIEKIRDKKYMASVSNLYFNDKLFNNNNQTSTPVKVDCAIKPSYDLSTPASYPESVNTNNQTITSTEPKKKRQYSTISTDTVKEICRVLLETGMSVSKTYDKCKNLPNVSVGKIRDIKIGKTHTKISEKFFNKKETNTETTNDNITPTTKTATRSSTFTSPPYLNRAFNLNITIDELIKKAQISIRQKSFGWVLSKLEASGYSLNDITSPAKLEEFFHKLISTMTINELMIMINE